MNKLFKLQYILKAKSLPRINNIIISRNIHNPVNLFSEEENMMRDTVSKFALEKIQPFVKKMDSQGFMESSIIDELFANGLMGIEIPGNYGGTESSFFSSILVIEELSKVDPSIGIIVDIQNTLIATLFMRLGTEEQRAYWLPKIAKNTIGSFALSESEAGSDAFALKTVATADGDDFLLNGSKMWISSSAEAGVFLVMANADISQGYKGITMFIVPKGTAGLTVGKKEDKLGLRASSTCQVHFDNVRIPKSAVLGQIGHGYRYAISFLNEGRVGIAAQMVGLSRGCLDYTMQYIRDRRQFNRSIWEFQAMKHQVAEVCSELESVRVFMYNVARQKEAGLDIQKEAAMVKYLSSNLATKITSRCIEWMGGVGFTKDFPIEKYYRDVKIGTIYEGTSNIQLNTIAKCLDKEHGRT